jgi:hypothetical protein
MAKYDPLARHLRRQRSPEVTMSFTELERAIGDMLPKSAQRPEWWANEADGSTRHVQCRAWLSVGYRASLLGAERVRFSRSSRDAD